MTMMKKMKARPKRAQLLNELIFTPRARPGGPVRVGMENVPRQDAAFFRAIAKVIEIWISRNWRW